MMRKCIEISVIFILIFAVFLGTSSAGHYFCPDDCLECRVMPSCCEQKMGEEMSGEGRGDTLLPGHQDGCNDRGACWDGASPDDASRITRAVEYEPSVILFYSINEIQAELLLPHPVLVSVQKVTSSFPPIFLQNCSFLI